MLARLTNTETDTGPRRSARGGERLCIATRQVRPVAEMIRFVAGPDGTVVPDLKRKLPGRGVWVTARRDALADAAKRGAFRRGLRADVKVPADLLATIERLLERSALDSLAIAHKAGQVVTGFARVEAAIASDPILALIHARDARPDGLRKIAAAVQRRHDEDVAKPVVIEAFTSIQLDLAIGRPNVVHAALLAGQASDAFIARWRNLERFRTGDPGDRGRGLRQPNQDAPELGS